jgi:hypothetical protein
MAVYVVVISKVDDAKTAASFRSARAPHLERECCGDLAEMRRDIFLICY